MQTTRDSLNFSGWIFIYNITSYYIYYHIVVVQCILLPEDSGFKSSNFQNAKLDDVIFLFLGFRVKYMTLSQLLTTILHCILFVASVLFFKKSFLPTPCLVSKTSVLYSIHFQCKWYILHMLKLVQVSIEAEWFRPSLTPFLFASSSLFSYKGIPRDLQSTMMQFQRFSLTSSGCFDQLRVWILPWNIPPSGDQVCFICVAKGFLLLPVNVTTLAYTAIEKTTSPVEKVIKFRTTSLLYANMLALYVFTDTMRKQKTTGKGKTAAAVWLCAYEVIKLVFCRQPRWIK